MATEHGTIVTVHFGLATETTLLVEYDRPVVRFFDTEAEAQAWVKALDLRAGRVVTPAEYAALTLS